MVLLAGLKQGDLRVVLLDDTIANVAYFILLKLRIFTDSSYEVMVKFR